MPVGHEIDAFYGTNGAIVVNATDVDPVDIAQAVVNGPDPVDRRLMATMSSWVQGTQPRRIGGMFDRDRFLSPDSIPGQIRVARRAMRDDVIGGAADITEALALSSLSIDCEDRDQADVWNQWAADANLDARLREMWRSLFCDSQVVLASWWTRKSYTPRGTGDAGRPKRANFDLLVPTELSLIDSLKVAPVGTLLFGREYLAYIAGREEGEAFDRILAGATPGSPPGLGGYGGGYGFGRNDPGVTGIPVVDDIVTRLILGRYVPDRAEAMTLEEEGIDPTNLFLLDPRYVQRHTLTRPSYQRFADVRLASCFELLDLKSNLRQMDRAHLLGSTNFIVLIKKGTDQHPALQPEIAALRANAATLATTPVVVGDHRLSIDIVTPTMDSTLDRKRHDVLDVRLTARAFGTFVATGSDQDDPIKLGKVIAWSLESRRRMVRRFVELNIFEAIRRNNEKLTDRAKLEFHPASIGLSFDQAWASFLLDLRTANEISRDTILSQFGMDQDDEARRREVEAEEFDDIFKTQVPFSAPLAAPPGQDPDGTPSKQDPKSGGRQGGGLRNGGGAAPGSGQGQPARNPRHLSDMNRDELRAVASDLGMPGVHRKPVDTLRVEIAARRAELRQLLEEDDDV